MTAIINSTALLFVLINPFLVIIYLIDLVHKLDKARFARVLLRACLAVTVAVLASLVIMILLKILHDYVRPRNERLIHRYIEIAGRITALFVGTISVQMIMQGVRTWAQSF